MRTSSTALRCGGMLCRAGCQEPDDEGVNEFSFSSLAVDILHEDIMWLDGIPHDWAVQVHGTSLQQRFGDKFIRRCIEIFKDHHFR